MFNDEFLADFKIKSHNGQIVNRKLFFLNRYFNFVFIENI